MSRADEPARTVVAVFVKTPGRSALKTRLAESLEVVDDVETAESLYRDSLDCVREAIDASGLARTWAVAETDATGNELWSDAPTLAQPAGDLGARMAGIYRALKERFPAVVLVGGDLPQLSPGDLRDAAEWLETPDRHAIGPARDGGFWLYGSSAENPTARWPGLPYSRRETAERFRSAIDAPAERWLELPTRTDLDDRGDLAGVANELERLEAPTASQRRLAERLRRLLDVHP